LLNLVKFNLENISICKRLLSQNIDDFLYFKKLGFFIKRINSLVKKRNNLSICLIKTNILIRFIIGDLISIEKKLEYEILLIYVDNIFRKRGFASYLINALAISSFIQPLRKLLLKFQKAILWRSNYIKKINLIKLEDE